jgi:hypothetical protein
VRRISARAFHCSVAERVRVLPIQQKRGTIREALTVCISYRISASQRPKLHFALCAYF